MTAGESEPAQLQGRTAAWGWAGSILLLLCVAAGLWLRLRGLSVEGFADDEIHKWLAAGRYLHGEFTGDDAEHPMLMKWLVTAARALLSRSWTPEAITRLPNALAGGLSIWMVAQLGRRLLGRAAGLIAAALAAFSTTFIGYQRIAKEDTLAGLFLMLALWAFAEARAAAADGRDRERGRWELATAAACGAMLASKYYVVLPLILPLTWAWTRDLGLGRSWRIPARRWAGLVGVALAVFLAIDWAILLPGTWHYLGQLFTQQPFTDRSRSETYWFMGRLWGNLAFHYQNELPVWFLFAFVAVKLAPATVLLAGAGLVLALLRRRPAERLILIWIAVWAFQHGLVGAKYARFAVAAMPAFLLLAAAVAVELSQGIGRLAGHLSRARRPAWAAPVAAVLGLLLAGGEARAALQHAPHYRLYLNGLAGGDRMLGWWFPHCDYFDAGVREAVAWVGAHAERGAEVSSEVEWPVQYYARRDGRPDLVTSFIRPRGCSTEQPCYLLVQDGRRYAHNEAALDQLARREPVHVERIRGRDVVKVYRLDGSEALVTPEADKQAVR